jgi:RNA polymerase sigma-70 factor (ECF subfamily)
LVDKLNKIIYGCQERDPGAQKELYEVFKTKMFGICMRYAGDFSEAQDILHDGFLKIYQKVDQYKFKGSFEGWIRKIMVNTALERFRTKYKTVDIDDSYKELDRKGSENISSDISAKELLKLIQELSPRYRMVFNLYAIEGYSHKEISEMMNISEGTSKSNLSRARAILQDKIKKYYKTIIQIS